MIAPNDDIAFTVPGVPIAWARARRGGRVTFTPERQRSWKGVAQVFMLQAKAGRPALEGPLEVVIDAVWPRPVRLAKRLGAGRIPRTARPDADNLGKNLCDAGNGVLWTDDALVVDLRVRKWVAAEGEEPGVHVRVGRAQEGEALREKC